MMALTKVVRSSLPETTQDDLRTMGITPEMVRDQLRAHGADVDGELKGFYLPGDRDSETRRCRNDAKSDWTVIKTSPPYILKQGDYVQNYTNFDSQDPVEFQFSNSVTITTGMDYSQSRSFDVSVNASIPIGKAGPMIGFNASLSSTEVHNKSYSKSTSYSTNFGVIVPGGEGKRVAETTTETSADSIWEAKIGPVGAVGVTIDPAWWKPNRNVWFTRIQYVFPNANASSRITSGSLDTTVDLEITRLYPPGQEGTGQEYILGEMESFEAQPFGKRDAKDSAKSLPLVDPFAFRSAEASKGYRLPYQTGNMVESYLKVRITYNTAADPVPIPDRYGKTEAFRSRIYQQRNNLAISHVSAVIMGPEPDVEYGEISIRYNKAEITEIKLKAGIANCARQVSWEGHGYHLSYFG